MTLPEEVIWIGKSDKFMSLDELKRWGDDMRPIVEHINALRVENAKLLTEREHFYGDLLRERAKLRERISELEREVKWQPT